jgi:hypothetical protein
MDADRPNAPEPVAPGIPKTRNRIWLRRTLRLFSVAFLLTVAAALFWLRTALYHRFIRFPLEEAAWQSLRAERQPVVDDAGWREYRGICHSHSHFSHDSEMSFEAISQALDIARLDFICMSDHCIEGRADFNWQWRGFHEGKLFIPGFEMNDGIMPFGVAAGIVLSNRTDPATLARQIVGNGGVLFYAHPEEKRDWDRPELTGMEIYNLHSDFKRARGGLGALLPEVIVNLRRYPDHVCRLMFNRPVEFLQHWDELNRTRHITGIAGNDCHQNVGFRAFYTTNGAIRIEDTSPRTLKELQLNGLTRIVARVLFGPSDPGQKLFHIQLDPYERSARFVNTHALAHELTEPSILEALRSGRVFIGFDMIADSSGFRWFARDGSSTAVMGEAGPFSAEMKLHAMSPLPCRFTILKDGQQVQQAEGRAIDWTPPAPGKYRVEAELKILDEWTPWVYANPIELR